MVSTVVSTDQDKQCEYYWYCVDLACNDIRYGIFCPLSVTLTSAQLYTIAASNMQFLKANNLPGDMYSAISDNNGKYKAYQIDIGGSVLSANVIIVSNFASNLTKNCHSQNNSFGFTITNEIPANGYIQLLSAGSNFGFECQDSDFCWIARTTNDNELDSIQCQLQCSNSYQLRFKLKSTLASGAWKLHFFGLSVGNPTNDIDSFSLQSYSPLGPIIDQTSTLGSISFMTQSSTPSISLGKYYIDFLYLNAYTTVQLDFKITNKSYLYRNEYLEFNLLPLFDQATQSQIMCRLLQNGIQVLDFKNCLIDNSKIKLYPKSDIKLNPETEFSLYLENVLIFSSNNPIQNITFSLYSQNYILAALLQAQQIHIDSISNLPLVLDTQSQFVLYKQPLNYVYLPTDYTFTYITNETFTTSTRIILKFPQYYLPRLSTSLILCKINDKYTSHSFLSPRVLALQFKTLNYEIEKGTPFNITIYKITQPFLSSATDLSKIMIGISQQNETFAESYWYSDAPLQSSLSKASSCSLHKVSYSTYYIRSYSTLTLTFKFSEISLNYKFNMTIFLNSLFETQLKYAIPSCHLVLLDDNYSQELDCDNTYTSIDIYNISIPDGVTSQVFEIELVGIPTPFYQINEKEYLIVFHYHSNTTNNTAIAYWTSTIKRNYDLLSFTANPELVDLELYKQQENSQVQYNLIDGITTPYEFEILPGFYSRKYKIKAGDIINGSNLEFFHDDQNRLITHPETLLLKVGMEELEFTLGYSYNQAQGAVETQFFKTGLGVLDTFQELGRIKLSLLPPTKQEIQMIDYVSNYVIAVGGCTQPIYINITETVPVEEFFVICNITQGENIGNYMEFYGATGENKSQIIMPFNKNTVFGIIVIQSSSHSSYEVTTEINCYVQETNSDIFYLSNSQFKVTTLAAVQEDTTQRNENPALEIASVDNSFSTQIILQLDANQDNVLIWWHLSYNNSITSYSQEEIARKLPAFQYSYNDPYENQIGVFYNKKAYITSTLEIHNLFANYTYKIVFLLENQYGRQSQKEYIFTTLDNEASLFRLTLAFNGNLTQELMKQVCCFNQIYFRILLSNNYQPQFFGGPNAINCWSDISTQEDTAESNTTSNDTIKATSYSNLEKTNTQYPIFYIMPNISYETFVVDAYNYTYLDLYTEFNSANFYTKLYEYIPSLPDSLYTDNILTEFVKIPRQPPNIIFHFSSSSWEENQKLTNFTISESTPFGHLYLVFTNYSTVSENQTKAIENELKGDLYTEPSNLFNFVAIKQRVTNEAHYQEFTNNGQYYFFTAHIFLNATNSKEQVLTFSDLTKNMTYSLYYFVTSEDPTINSQASDVYKLTLRIEKQAVFAKRMLLQSCGLITLGLLLFGLLI